MPADVNVTEKVARELIADAARSHLAMGTEYATRLARRLLAVLSDPEVLAGMAGVLAEHQHDVTSYDAWDLHGCDCGWEVPDQGADGAWGLYRAHVATALADRLRGHR